MTETADPTPQDRMNALYRQTVTGIRMNAERDLRLARAAGNAADQARAQARLDTLNAALGIYEGAHRAAHGTRPWPREPRPCAPTSPPALAYSARSPTPHASASCASSGRARPAATNSPA